MTKMVNKCSTDQSFIRKRNTAYKIHTLGYVSTNVHDLVFWHALALLIKSITSFVEHPIALKNQSYTSQAVQTFQGSCSTQPFWQIKNGLVPGR